MPISCSLFHLSNQCIPWQCFQSPCQQTHRHAGPVLLCLDGPLSLLWLCSNDDWNIIIMTGLKVQITLLIMHNFTTSCTIPNNIEGLNCLSMVRLTQQLYFKNSAIFTTWWAGRKQFMLSTYYIIIQWLLDFESHGLASDREPVTRNRVALLLRGQSVPRD